MSEGISARKGISAATLKWIALVTMTIDHFAASGLYLQLAYGDGVDVLGDTGYMVLRTIGRLAFPIYCFLLTEGFRRTRSREHYALRLGVFALISEIPFDLAGSGEMWNGWHQNVFFTLLFGLLALMLEEPHIDPADLARLTMPVLVIAGEDDLVRPEHTRLIYESLPNAGLVILPGTHTVALDDPAAFNAAIWDFFAQTEGEPL